MCEERERILKRTTETSEQTFYFNCSRCKKALVVNPGETYYSTEESKMIVCLKCKEKEEREEGFHDNLTLEASSIIKSRESIYGPPAKNFQRIARLWNSYINGTGKAERMELGPNDVGMMMILVKMARLMETPDHLDSLIDIAGYAECLKQIGEEE